MENIQEAVALNVVDCKCKYPNWAVSVRGVKVFCCRKHLSNARD